jgi:hypothetical protein
VWVSSVRWGRGGVGEAGRGRRRRAGRGRRERRPLCGGYSSGGRSSWNVGETELVSKRSSVWEWRR